MSHQLLTLAIKWILYDLKTLKALLAHWGSSCGAVCVSKSRRQVSWARLWRVYRVLSRCSQQPSICLLCLHFRSAAGKSFFSFLTRSHEGLSNSTRVHNAYPDPAGVLDLRAPGPQTPSRLPQEEGCERAPGAALVFGVHQSGSDWDKQNYIMENKKKFLPRKVCGHQYITISNKIKKKCLK